MRVAVASGVCMRLTVYADVRHRMKPGDVIAFGGKGGISDGIKFFTRAPVSHVGCILQRRMMDDRGMTQGARFFNEVIESTSLYGVVGVQTTRLSDHVRGYGGDLWWLPLAEDFRHRFDGETFFDFMFRQIGKDYDLRQAMEAGIDFLDWAGIGHAEEDFSKFFCSELVAAGLRAAGTLPLYVNPSERTPIDVCRFAMYEGCYQLKGEPKAIPGFNAMPVA